MVVPSPYGWKPKPVAKPAPKPVPYTTSPKLPTGTSTTVAGTSSLPWYMNPSANARPDTQYDWQPYLDQSRTLTPAEQSMYQMQIKSGATGPTQPPASPLSQRYGGGGGGGGGGGAAAATGLDQATLDWLFGQLGMGKPKPLTQTQLDLPDPSQYYKWDNSLYNTAREGVTSGIQGIRDRGNTAFDQAGVELAQYQNPYGAGLQTQNPDLQSAMQRMMDANGVNPGQIGATNNEGIQADRAMRNTLAILAGTDQARQAGNLRALAGDRTTFDQNLGLEGNMLNLGVNMSEAKGKSAFDQMLQGLMYDSANTEASQIWQRGNTVADTNVGNANQWNQGLMDTLLAMVGAKAPGTTLPAATGGWYA